jgi:hypothetical protein
MGLISVLQSITAPFHTQNNFIRNLNSDFFPVAQFKTNFKYHITIYVY